MIHALTDLRDLCSGYDSDNALLFEILSRTLEATLTIQPELTDGEFDRLIAELKFYRDRFGAPGCESRKRAAWLLDLIAKNMPPGALGD